MNKNKKYIVIAISGMPAAGKTTVSLELLNQIPNLVYFDFGAFFRAITFYLLKVKKMSLEDIKEIVRNSKTKELMNFLEFGYRKKNKSYEISINGIFFDEKDLYTPEMNKLTVDIGSCFGDELNSYIKIIIDEIRQKNPVLLNARRPFAVCNDISNHIFLRANFLTRAARKARLEQTNLEEAIDRLRKRDDKEVNAGFWEIFPVTKVIDTTDKTIEETIELIIEHIMSFSIDDFVINTDHQK